MFFVESSDLYVLPLKYFFFDKFLLTKVQHEISYPTAFVMFRTLSTYSLCNCNGFIPVFRLCRCPFLAPEQLHLSP